MRAILLPSDKVLKIRYTDDKELKTILGNKLFLRGAYPNQSYTDNLYRDFVRFFVKDDINRHKQNDPINFLDYQERKARLIAYNF